MFYITIGLLLLVAGAAAWRAMALQRRVAELSRLNAEAAIAAERAAAEAAVSTERIAAERDHLAATLDAARADASTQRTRIETLTAELTAERQLSARREETIRLNAIEQTEREKLMEERFKNLANDILRQNSAELKEQNEQRLGEILSPLRTNLEEFRKTVTDTYNAEARERFSLAERIRDLAALNQTISRETHELTRALKGNNQVQGDWGEMILESILEKSGLHEGQEYSVQVTTDADGNQLRGEGGKHLRPDVVVNYPDGRCVVIDSKVSLTAYMDHINADTDDDARAAAVRHVRSVRNHIDELARKNYQHYIGGDSKLDFVMMFIPNEPAYITAMRTDPALWQEAYARNVLIVSPTHLVSGLRLIEQLWSRDKITKNAIKIAEEAGKMFDKFADFTADMERIEKGIASTSKAYSEAMTKLTSGRGNLVGRAQKLATLGIKATKQLAASATKQADTDEDTEGESE